MIILLAVFYVAGLFLIYGAVTSLYGDNQVVIAPEASFVSSGVGPLRWKRKFVPQLVRTVRLDSQYGNSSTICKIEIVGEQRLRFGAQMNFARMEWTAAILKEILVDYHRPPSGKNLPVIEWLPPKPVSEKLLVTEKGRP